jgi:hypothetical protein
MMMLANIKVRQNLSKNKIKMYGNRSSSIHKKINNKTIILNRD